MIATIASAATLIVVGRVVDYAPVAKVAAAVCIGLALWCISLSQVSSLLGLGITLFGLRLFGQGLMTHTAMTAMGRWYERERGRAVSITALGHQIGEGVLPLVVISFVAVTHWTVVWQYAATVLLLFGLPLIVLLMRVERHPRGSKPHDVQTLRKQYSHREAIQDPYFWVLCSCTLAPAFIGTSFFFHQQHIGDVKGWSYTLIAAAFSAMAISNVVCALSTGWLVDRFSAVRLLPLYLLPLCLACLVISLFSSPNALWVFMVLLGASGGTANTLLSAVWPEVYGTRHLGAIRGTVMAGMVFSSALGPGVTGLFIDQGITFPQQTWFMAVFCLAASLLLAYVSRVLRDRQSRGAVGTSPVNPI